MKLKNTLLVSAMLSAAAMSAHAATELTPEQASALKPYDRVVITGRYTAIGDAVNAMSRKADKEGAASFYVVDTSDYGNSGNWRVTADLYKEDAPKADAPKNRIINGVMELPKDQAVALVPYDTVTDQGFYRSQPAKPKAQPPSLSSVRWMLTMAVTSVLPPTSIKPMRKNACCRARMPFRQILTPGVSCWRKAVKRRNRLRSRAWQQPPPSARAPA